MRHTSRARLATTSIPSSAMSSIGYERQLELLFLHTYIDERTGRWFAITDVSMIYSTIQACVYRKRDNLKAAMFGFAGPAQLQ